MVIILLFGLSACGREHPANKRTEIPFPQTKADFQSVNISPILVYIDNNKVRRIKAGKPDIAQYRHHHNVSGYSQVTHPIISINTPGKGGIGYPEKLSLQGKTEKADMPEILPAKAWTYKSPNPLSIAAFDKMHGLRSNIVTSLIQDNDGNIWFGTSQGVTRYNGSTFANYTKNEGLVDNDIRSVFQDSRGNIWFGSLGAGFTIYDGYTFTSFTKGGGLPETGIPSIAEDKKGNVWLSMWEKGVIKFDGNSFVHYSTANGLMSNTVVSITAGKNGLVWFGTDKGIAKYDGKSFTNYYFQDGTKSVGISCILEDNTGRLWAGANTGALYYYDRGQWNCFYAANKIINDIPFALLQDRGGNIWIGTRSGLTKFNGKTFLSYTEDDGLTSSNIYCLLQDMAGNIWIGTGGGGVLKYSPGSFYHITENEGLPRNFVFSTFEDKNQNLWIGTWRGGVTKFDGGKFETFTRKQGLPVDDVRCTIQDADGNLWFATYKGIVKYDGRYFTIFDESTGLVNNDVNDLFEDSAGNLWIGTEKGLSKFDKKSFTNYFSQETHTTAVYLTRQDQSGNILLCTSGGLFRSKANRWYHLNNLQDAPVQSVSEDKNKNLWLGTTDGIRVYDGTDLFTINEKAGLINNNVTGILRDHKDNMWFSTRGGLSNLTPRQRELLWRQIRNGGRRVDDVFFLNYGYYENFLGIGNGKQSLTETHQHQICIGTDKGVTLFNSENELPEANAPVTRITAFKIGDEAVDWNTLRYKQDTSIIFNSKIELRGFRFTNLRRWTGVPEDISLDYRDNYVSIDFAGIATFRPQDLKYQFLLDGLSKNPEVLTGKTSVTFVNLQPGDYTFKVRAMNYLGIWGNFSYLPFTIRPAWWQTWWFKIFAGIFLAMLLLGISRTIYRYKLQKQKHELEKELAIQYERQRISSDLHDEIGSTLSSINIYTSLAQKDENKNSYLEVIGNNIADVVGKLDDLVWKINPRYDNLGSVIYRLASYAEPTAKAKNIVLHIGANEEIKTYQLRGEAKHHLFLMSKELLNNAMKHSGCRNVYASFEKVNNDLLVTISDDGRGFDHDTTFSHRNGLHNLRQRADEMKWGLSIDSVSGGGTRTVIRLPAH